MPALNIIREANSDIMRSGSAYHTLLCDGKRQRNCQNSSGGTKRHCTAFTVGGEGRSRRGSASFRGADAAEVCSNCNDVGFVADDGAFEWSSANAAKHVVSEIR